MSFFKGRIATKILKTLYVAIFVVRKRHNNQWYFSSENHFSFSFSFWNTKSFQFSFSYSFTNHFSLVSVTVSQIISVSVSVKNWWKSFQFYISFSLLKYHRCIYRVGKINNPLRKSQFFCHLSLFRSEILQACRGERLTYSGQVLCEKV